MPVLNGDERHLRALEDGTKGARIAFDGGQLFLGRAKKGRFLTGRDQDFVGLLVTDALGKVLLEQAVPQSD